MSTGIHSCPFCRSGIKHDQCVPAARVRIGADYGDDG